MAKSKKKHHQRKTYNTGSTRTGIFVCTKCEREVNLKKSGRLPPCYKCSNTTFYKKQEVEMTDIENTGNYLRTLRLGKGLSTKDVTEKTRISETNIIAIEDQAFSSLPADTFTRGLLTIYAEFLGADPETVVTNYMEERHASPTEKKLPKTKSTGRIFTPKRMAEPAQLSSMTTAGILLVLIIVSFAGYCYYTSWNPFEFLTQRDGEIQTVMESVFPGEKSTTEQATSQQSKNKTVSIPVEQQPPQPVTSEEASPKKSTSSKNTAVSGVDGAPNNIVPEPEEQIPASEAEQKQLYTVKVRFLKDTSVDVTQNGNGTVTRYFSSDETYSWEDISSLTLVFADADSAEILVNDIPFAFPASTDGKNTLIIPLD
jgi:cytoskeletal protein RodZ